MRVRKQGPTKERAEHSSSGCNTPHAVICARPTSHGVSPVSHGTALLSTIQSEPCSQPAVVAQAWAWSSHGIWFSELAAFLDLGQGSQQHHGGDEKPGEAQAVQIHGHLGALGNDAGGQQQH